MSLRSTTECGLRLTSLMFMASVFCFVHTPYLLAQTQKTQALSTKERIRIDGKLDEPSWNSANQINTFTQVLPQEGGVPSERTEIRVLVDNDALYFGITCFDHNPSAIISTQLTRDAALEVDDHVSIVLDPFFDHRNGLIFTINPAGARADGQISNNSEFTSLDWDGIWNAHALITEEGWVAEIVIPFKTLRFKPGQSVWGLNVQRVIKRNIEYPLKRPSWRAAKSSAGNPDSTSD
jgi:hypothetical protein